MKINTYLIKADWVLYHNTKGTDRDNIESTTINDTDITNVVEIYRQKYENLKYSCRDEYSFVKYFEIYIINVNNITEKWKININNTGVSCFNAAKQTWSGIESECKTLADKQPVRKKRLMIKPEVVESWTFWDIQKLDNEFILKFIKKYGTDDKDYKWIILTDKGNPGNEWNSEVQALLYNKRTKRLEVRLYIQNDSTDTDIFVPYDEFMKPSIFTYNWGITTVKYNANDKAQSIKHIFLKYLKQ